MSSHETIKHVADATSIMIWAGALIEVLPAIAALVSIIWGLIRIYETETCKRLCRRIKTRKKDIKEE